MTTQTNRFSGMALTDHHFSLPLDHDQPQGEQITIYAREVVALEKEAENLPWLVFFQGGPGGPSPRPMNKSGWIKEAMKHYRVLLLDQRGTGRSTPVTFQSLQRFETAKEQADYLKLFRADSIVKDSELIRQQLVGENTPWSILGQSFGGFCAVNYLSKAAHGLKEVFITGGLPPLNAKAEDVYRLTYRRVKEKNQRYYARYPQDVERVHEITDFLQKNEVELPGGGILSAQRFQSLGLHFGFHEGFELVHYLIETAFIGTGSERTLSYAFLRDFEHALPYDSSLFFSILHEAAYGQGEATQWAAQRVREEFPEFQITEEQPVLFTGEMIYPWMFDETHALKPLKGAAEILAQYQDWAPLYDVEVLKNNQVPCAAIVYSEDMYVERHFSEETAEVIQGIKVWLTNEYEHAGLREDGVRIFGRLYDMVHGEIG